MTAEEAAELVAELDCPPSRKRHMVGGKPEREAPISRWSRIERANSPVRA